MSRLLTLSGQQVAGLDVQRGPLIPRVKQQVQQQKMALAPGEARAVGLRQANVPQCQRQDAEGRSVIAQLHTRAVSLRSLGLRSLRTITQFPGLTRHSLAAQLSHGRASSSPDYIMATAVYCLQAAVP